MKRVKVWMCFAILMIVMLSDVQYIIAEEESEVQKESVCTDTDGMTSDSLASDKVQSDEVASYEEISDEAALDDVMPDEIISDEKSAPGAVHVHSGEELESAVNSNAPDIYIDNDINTADLLRPIVIRHDCNIYGQGHRLYGSGYKQSQLTMRGENKTLNITELIYHDESEPKRGGCIVRQYAGTVNLYNCKTEGGMHGIRVDRGTANLYNFEAKTTTHGIAQTSFNGETEVNIYGKTVLTATNARFDHNECAGIYLDGKNQGVFNAHGPVIITGYLYGIYNRGILKNIPEGSIIYKVTHGVRNRYILDSISADIYGNETGICNNGALNSCNSRIHANSVGVLNDSIMTISGGDIYENTTGIDNSGTLRHTAGTVRANSSCGIYQRGQYYMSGDARVPCSRDYTNASSIASENNVIYLARTGNTRHVIRVPAPFNGLNAGMAPIAVIDSAAGDGPEGDRLAGREAVVVETADRAGYANTLMPYFALKFDKNYLNEGSKGWYANHWTDTSTGRTQNWMRAGNGVIGAQGSLYYSVRLSASYTNGFEGRETSLTGFETVTVNSSGVAYSPVRSVPQREEFWRGENTSFAGFSDRIKCFITLNDKSGNPTRRNLDGTFINTGYTCSLKAADNSTYDKPLSGGMTVPGKYLTNPVAFNATWSFKTDILYDGNGQTNEAYAPDYVREGYDFTEPVDDNYGPERNVFDDFGKPAYFENETDDDRYSFAGWSYKTDSQYKDEGVIKTSDTLVRDGSMPMDYIFDVLKKCRYIDDVNPTGNETSVGVRLYVVWDEYPKIEADDRAFTESEMSQGAISDEELLRKININDREDGNLKETGKVKLIYDISKLDGVSGEDKIKTMKVVVEAQDGFGNISTSQFMVRVFYDKSPESKTSDDSTEADEVRNTPIYVRFIDEKYYSLGLNDGSDEDKLSAWKNGACEPHSIWYEDDAYKTVIQEAMRRLSSEDYEYTFEYKADDIKEANEYSRSHSEEWIDNADAWHKSFYNEFLKPARILASAG